MLENQENTSKCTLLFLGTGTSVGVPMIGCNCYVCSSKNKKNKRYRSSVFINLEGKNILIDTTPDLRQQALKNNLTKVDYVLFTHAHVDHFVGFDELRRLSNPLGSPIPIFGRKSTIDMIEQCFSFAFKAKEHNRYLGYVFPKKNYIERTFFLYNFSFETIDVIHGTVETIGYLIKKGEEKILAYIPDCKTLPNEGQKQIKGVKTIIIDALRKKPHPTHLSLSESIEIAKSCDAKYAYFTHIGHEMEHAEVQATLPHNYLLAHDGLEVVL